MTDESGDESFVAPKPKHAGGRSDFNDEIASVICDRIANGESLRSICAEDGMPEKSTVMRWLAKHESFQDQYARARELQADALFDEVLDIADDGSNDWMERNFGEDTRWVENGEALRRSVLRVDARKWMAGKLRPKKYGDRQQVEHSGTVTTTLDPEALRNLTEDQLEQLRSIAAALTPEDAGE